MKRMFEALDAQFNHCILKHDGERRNRFFMITHLDNRERIELDKDRCEQLFRSMKARTKKEDIRFCRRIGEKNSEPRPMVIGLETEEEKRHILARARNLQGTQYSDISVVPDLTKKQRSKEARMKQEAEERNRNLTADERKRNEKWLVVGRRGEKRMIKGIERDVQYMGNARQEKRYSNANSVPLGPRILPANDKPREDFRPRQAEQDKNRQDEGGRWYTKDRGEKDTGARKKDNYGQGNQTSREKDKQENSNANSRWEDNSDRIRKQIGRDRANSKRNRNSTSSEDENPESRRSRRF
jgi:hypothetical protein